MPGMYRVVIKQLQKGDKTDNGKLRKVFVRDYDEMHWSITSNCSHLFSLWKISSSFNSAFGHSTDLESDRGTDQEVRSSNESTSARRWTTNIGQILLSAKLFISSNCLESNETIVGDDEDEDEGLLFLRLARLLTLFNSLSGWKVASPAVRNNPNTFSTSLNRKRF